MSIKTLHETADDKTWFITFTCYNWIPLFEIANSYNIIYEWLKLIAVSKGIKTLAFVIMPNHVHLLLQLTDDKADLNKVISNGKRFMAYAIVERLEKQGCSDLLTKLNLGCSAREVAKGQKHKVFEKSFDAKPVYSLPFLKQKLDYIHHNPVSGKWNLCNEFTDYVHGSAAFYELERPHPFVDIAHYCDYWL